MGLRLRSLVRGVAELTHTEMYDHQCLENAGRLRSRAQVPQHDAFMTLLVHELPSHDFRFALFEVAFNLSTLILPSTIAHLRLIRHPAPYPLNPLRSSSFHNEPASSQPPTVLPKSRPLSSARQLHSAARRITLATPNNNFRRTRSIRLARTMLDKCRQVRRTPN